MAEYKLGLGNTGVIRKADNTFIPEDEGNADYQAFLAWLQAGNTPDPAETAEEISARLGQAQEVAGQQTLQTDLKLNTVFATLKAATPAQISTFVDNQFAAFTVQQKAVMKLLIQVAALTVRRL